MIRQRSLGPGRLSPTKRARGTTVWVLDYRDSTGARRREKLGTDRRVAERRHAELIRQRDLETAGLGSAEGQGRTLAELRNHYVADLPHRATPAYVANTTARLDRVLKGLPARRVRDLKTHDVIRFRSILLARGVGVTTANMHTGVLSAMLNWAASASLIAENPIRNLKRLPENETTKRHRRRALTEDEIARFLAAAEADDRHWEQWQPGRVPQAPLFKALLETGARYNELARLTWSDVDLERAMITLRAENTKSRKARSIPLRREMVGVLRGLQRGERVFLTPDGAPWCRATNNLMRTFNRILRAAGIERVDEHGRKIDLHGLRHTLASRLARSGVGLVQAQRILGHASPRLTAQVYTHLDVEDLRNAVETLAPQPRGAVAVLNRY